MKLLFAAVLNTLLLVSIHSYAYSGYKNSCSSNACPAQYCSECQCTDRGYYDNNCISKSRYCQAFGNVGGR
jgi:hypothetical protein